MAGKRARATSPAPSVTTSTASSPAPDDAHPPAKRSRVTTLEDMRLAFMERYKPDKFSAAEILKAQMANWRSSVYNHFITPPTIIEVDGEVRYKFVCAKKTNISGSVFVTRVRHDTSTSNLKRHVDECTPDDVRAKKILQDFLGGSTYDPAKFRVLMALWIARRHRPFLIAEDPELQSMFEMLCSKVDPLSRVTVSRDIKEIFSMTRRNVAKLLASSSRALHAGIDGWTSPNVISVLGITIQYFNRDEGKITSFILDFIILRRRHTGVYLAEELAKAFQEYGIEKKILSLVADNARNNDTLVTELDTLLPDAPFTSSHRTRCFAHILNLISKAVLSQFTQSKKTANTDTDTDTDLFDEHDEDDEFEFMDEVDDDDDLETDASRDESDDRLIAAIANELDIVNNLTSAEVTLGCYSMTKILGLAKRVFHSSLLRDDMKKLCVKCKIDVVTLARAVPTRWNTVATALKRAIVLRPAIDKLVTMEQHNTSRGPKLRKYRLSNEEWDVLKQLSPLLQRFLAATERISKSAVPLVHEVIPLIDSLTDTLAAAVLDEALHPVVRAAMARGVEVLNRYYSKTDDSVMYRLAMLLHPRYKTAYFTRQGWLTEWIDNAIALLREEYEKNYAGARVTESIQTERDDNTDDFFKDIDEYGLDYKSDPIDDWLSTGPVRTAQDPLTWWSGMLADNHPLAAMALDFLSAPASSTDVERAFSRGGLTVSKRRHSLSDESLRAATVLSSWADVEGLIPEAEIVEHFRDKKSRFVKPVCFGNEGDSVESVDSA